MIGSPIATLRPLRGPGLSKYPGGRGAGLGDIIHSCEPDQIAYNLYSLSFRGGKRKRQNRCRVGFRFCIKDVKRFGLRAMSKNLDSFNNNHTKLQKTPQTIFISRLAVTCGCTHHALSSLLAIRPLLILCPPPPSTLSICFFARPEKAPFSITHPPPFSSYHRKISLFCSSPRHRNSGGGVKASFGAK